MKWCSNMIHLLDIADFFTLMKSASIEVTKPDTVCTKH